MMKHLVCASLCTLAMLNTAGAQEAPALLETGKTIALKAKAELGKNLIQTVTNEGAVAAVEFCNVQALPITQRVSEELGATITRVSDQPRNPNNAANERELAYIANAKAALARKEPAKPALHEIDGKTVGYYPITTNSLCLQCHGVPGKDVASDTLAVLAEKYPDDQALGYGLDELRGIWVIGMEQGTDNDH